MQPCIPITDDSTITKKRKRDGNTSDLLPITLLGGFLGAGKTSLLKHILETKHGEDFKCAVIVNDVAELNIDKSLIDQSVDVAHSDDIIAMENGCVCCSLSNDLVNQIIRMANSGNYSYMIIEASGISEPAAIASLFEEEEEECDDEEHEHHENMEDHIALCDVARLDTCVTVVDASEFFTNFETVVPGANSETWSKLLVEQIEYANVIVLNKLDLVSDQSEIERIQNHIMALNGGRAKILLAEPHSILGEDNIRTIIDTHSYRASDFRNNLSNVIPYEQEELDGCCEASVLRGESPCCKKARTIRTKLSEVLLASKTIHSTTRHETRFGITSFVYKATRPFHSQRFHTKFVDKYFCFLDLEEEEEEEEEDEGEDNSEGHDNDADVVEMKEEDQNDNAGGKVNSEEDEKIAVAKINKIAKLNQEAKNKQTLRSETIGTVLRSKGFLWTPHTHDVMVNYGQAGNHVNMELGNTWKVLNKRAWNEGTKEEIAFFRKDFHSPQYGDRRQEIVFIGDSTMKSTEIQNLLDSCLLTDEEYALGIDGWKATVEDMFM